MAPLRPSAHGVLYLSQFVVINSIASAVQGFKPGTPDSTSSAWKKVDAKIWKIIQRKRNVPLVFCQIHIMV
jgi:hypothetical protein